VSSTTSSSLGASGTLKVERSSLQGIEKKSGALGFDLVIGDGADDLHERDLDCVGVFEGGEIEGAVLCGLELVARVEVAETLAAQAGDPHWVPLTLRCWQRGIGRIVYSTPVSSFESCELRVEGHLECVRVRGKILKRKASGVRLWGEDKGAREP
jgi:hypothetical protein